MYVYVYTVQLCQMSTWLNSAVCVDVGRSSVVSLKAAHEVRPTVQKGFGLGTTRGAP